MWRENTYISPKQILSKDFGNGTIMIQQYKTKHTKCRAYIIFVKNVPDANFQQQVHVRMTFHKRKCINESLHTLSLYFFFLFFLL